MLKSSQSYTALELSDLQDGTQFQPAVKTHRAHSTDVTSQKYDSPESTSLNTAPGTKTILLAGLVLSALAGVASIVTGIISKGSNHSWRLSPVVKEFSILPVNVLLLLITECLGYIHATSLRWTLFYEGKLQFNTNLRLTTFSQRFGPNNAFFSTIFFICTTLTYGAGNMLLVFNTSSFYYSRISIDGVHDSDVKWDDVKDLASLTKSVPIVLGLVILTMCAIDLWCLRTTTVPSWSSDPLTTVTVGLRGGLVPRSGRAMMSVRERDLPARPTLPATKQPSPNRVSRSAIKIICLDVLALLALVIWSAVITYVAYSNKDYQGQNGNGSSWQFIPTTTGAFAHLNGETGGNELNAENATLTVFLFFFASAGMGVLSAVSESRMIGVLLLYTVFQTIITISMHCAELQVQLTRDEGVWRKLQSRSGSQEQSIYNSIMQPLEYWQSAGLLVFKVLMHWLFGAAVQIDYGQGMLMRPPQIVYMTVAWLGFVIFVVCVTWSTFTGPLPATYGHLQTMVDIADEWSEKMYWGDKGVSSADDGSRHCGTSSQALPPVVPGQFYI